MRVLFRAVCRTPDLATFSPEMTTRRATLHADVLRASAVCLLDHLQRVFPRPASDPTRAWLLWQALQHTCCSPAHTPGVGICKESGHKAGGHTTQGKEDWEAR